jgi:hypothetical protein
VDLGQAIVVTNEQEFRSTVERIRHMQNQAAYLRQVETNPANYQGAVSGFLVEIDRMRQELRDYLNLRTDDMTQKLVDFLVQACQCQSVRSILAGREGILALPRAWLLANIEQVVSWTLDLSDEWEYRRLLEAYDLIDKSLVRRLVAQGLLSCNLEVREAAEDFAQPGG